MRSNASSVMTLPSVARIAASDRALPASVPPTPPTSAFFQSVCSYDQVAHTLRHAVRAARDARPEGLADRDEVGIEAPRLRCTRPGPR